MIVGIGLDVVEMPRMAEIVATKPNFIKRILTPQEWQVFNSRKGQRQIEFIAGRFACKEAFSKAYGTGIGREVSFQDIEVLTNAKGAPVVTQSPFTGSVFESITHTKEIAVAQIILEKKD